MAKNRKKTFPKPVPRLNESNALLLGKNSNYHEWANRKAIYDSPAVVKSNINDKQLKTLVTLRRTLGML